MRTDSPALPRSSVGARSTTGSDTWFAVAAGVLCLLWAFAAWLSVVPNQDMLVDAIQAQTVLHDPRLVLAFPGQKHGGVVEYPIQMLAEWLVPGNYYVHTVARVVFAFLTGFLAARLFATLYPNVRRWAFLAAVAVGPAIIHGMSGPADNPVGVFWLVGNYDTSWLLVTAGALVLARALRSGSTALWRYAVAGLLAGSGFYAHPNIALLIAPLAVLVIVTYGIRLVPLAVTLVGAVVGVIPSVVSYVVNADITTWDPSHPPWIATGIYMNVLGIDGLPSYFTVILPYALGLPTSQSLFSGSVQSVAAGAFAVVILVSSVVGVARALVQRRRPSPGATLALAWLAAIGAMIAFATFVNPVWFYATSLAILFWISIGLLPSLFRSPRLGAALTVGVVVLAGLATISQNLYFYRDFGGHVAEKANHLNDLHHTADLLEAAGATFIYGSYYDAIPIGYASDLRLRTVTSTYDRLPLTDRERALPEITVATRLDPNEPWGQEALTAVTDGCSPPQARITTPQGSFGIFRCQPRVIDSRAV